MNPFAKLRVPSASSAFNYRGAPKVKSNYPIVQAQIKRKGRKEARSFAKGCYKKLDVNNDPRGFCPLLLYTFEYLLLLFDISFDIICRVCLGFPALRLYPFYLTGSFIMLLKQFVFCLVTIYYSLQLLVLFFYACLDCLAILALEILLLLRQSLNFLLLSLDT